MVRASVYLNAAPRTTSIIASVTMNAGIRSGVTAAPFTSPGDQADAETGGDRRQRHRRRRASRSGAHDARERDDRADRQIDAGGQDDERHARRRGSR